LFALPAAAAAENWVWDAIDTALAAAFDAIDAGQDPDHWLDSVPPERRDVLDRETLTTSIVGVIEAYRALQPIDRAIVREAHEDQRDLPGLFEGHRTATVKSALPASFVDPISALAEASWTALKPLGLRKRSYKAFYEGLPEKVCAFCGLEAFQTVDLNRETLDHYLPRSLYPFVGADMRNLVWMSRTCNSGYKHARDTLRTDSGARRACYNPYTAPGIKISLLSSDLFGRGALPQWVISMQGDPAKCASWDALFNILDRWKDHLDRQHEICLKNVGTLLRDRGGGALPDIRASVRTAAELAANEGMHAFAFLKRAILELWEERLERVNEERDRLVAQLLAARTYGPGRL